MKTEYIRKKAANCAKQLVQDTEQHQTFYNEYVSLAQVSQTLLNDIILYMDGNGRIKQSYTQLVNRLRDLHVELKEFRDRWEKEGFFEVHFLDEFDGQTFYSNLGDSLNALIAATKAAEDLITEKSTASTEDAPIIKPSKKWDLISPQYENSEFPRINWTIVTANNLQYVGQLSYAKYKDHYTLNFDIKEIAAIPRQSQWSDATSVSISRSGQNPYALWQDIKDSAKSDFGVTLNIDTKRLTNIFNEQTFTNLQWIYS